ncbi:MAG: dihydropteroate synthase [Candidatus Hodgkinia cicadicola]
MKIPLQTLEVVREQLLNGADIIDLNINDALINSLEEMKRFIGLLGSEPDLAKVPLWLILPNDESYTKR